MSDTNGAKRTTLSLAAFVLICFFLPWVQVGCETNGDSISGFEIARETDAWLWLIPALMFVIIITSLAGSAWEKLPWIFALISIAGGSITAFLMYYERSKMTGAPRLVAMQWTLFFWLGLIAALGIIASTFAFYINRSRSP